MAQNFFSVLPVVTSYVFRYVEMVLKLTTQLAKARFATRRDIYITSTSDGQNCQKAKRLPALNLLGCTDGDFPGGVGSALGL